MSNRTYIMSGGRRVIYYTNSAIMFGSGARRDIRRQRNASRCRYLLVGGSCFSGLSVPLFHGRFVVLPGSRGLGRVFRRLSGRCVRGPLVCGRYVGSVVSGVVVFLCQRCYSGTSRIGPVLDRPRVIRTTLGCVCRRFGRSVAIGRVTGSLNFDPCCLYRTFGAAIKRAVKRRIHAAHYGCTSHLLSDNCCAI